MTRMRRSGPVERLAGLQALDALGERARVQARQRSLEEEEHREHARRQVREADLFREAVAGAVPLAPTGRVDPHRPAPPAAPRQRELDERAVLAASLSDEIGVEQFLDVLPAFGMATACDVGVGQFVNNQQLVP